MKRFIGLIFVLIFSTGIGFAQYSGTSSSISKVGTTAAQFLKIGVDARSIGMGGAFVAMGGDINSIYWNPSGLARMHGIEVTLAHNQWLVGTNFDYAAFAMGIYNLGTIGLSVTTLNYGDMKVRTLEQPDGTGEYFSANDLAIGATFARNLTDRFSIGFTAKYIYQGIWHMRASAFAFDIGTLFTTPFKNFRLGASISNFGNKMMLHGRDIKFSYDPDLYESGNVEIVNSQYELDHYSLPLMFRVGIAGELFQNDYNRVSVAVDAIHPNDNTESTNWGIEYAWHELFYLRAGYKALFLSDSEQGLTYGFGIHYRIVGTLRLNLDYAYADFGRLSSVNRYSISVEF